MVKPVPVLGFSLRKDEDESSENPYRGIEEAFGFRFESKVLGGMPVLFARSLGMDIIATRWKGIGGKGTLQLHGTVCDPKFLDAFPQPLHEFQEVDISEAVIALLQAYGQPGWRIPSSEEIEAEIEYDREFQRSKKTEDSSPNG
jgi:hypothetical protein